jgi:hypothetical protein
MKETNNQGLAFTSPTPPNPAPLRENEEGQAKKGQPQVTTTSVLNTFYVVTDYLSEDTATGALYKVETQVPNEQPTVLVSKLKARGTGGATEEGSLYESEVVVVGKNLSVMSLRKPIAIIGRGKIKVSNTSLASLRLFTDLRTSKITALFLTYNQALEAFSKSYKLKADDMLKVFREDTTAVLEAIGPYHPQFILLREPEFGPVGQEKVLARMMAQP